MCHTFQNGGTTLSTSGNAHRKMDGRAVIFYEVGTLPKAWIYLLWKYLSAHFNTCKPLFGQVGNLKHLLDLQLHMFLCSFVLIIVCSLSELPMRKYKNINYSSYIIFCCTPARNSKVPNFFYLGGAPPIRLCGELGQIRKPA